MKKDNLQKWIIGLLVLIVILQLLFKYPIVIDVKQCPEIICKDVSVQCNCKCLNGTIIEEPYQWYYEIKDWDCSYNMSDEYPTCWLQI